MKKVGKILLAIFLVVIVAVGALAIRYKQYVKVLWKSLTTSTEKIAEEREENNKKLVDTINSYLDEELRDFTEEEQERIEAGEDKAKIYAEILSERSGKKYVYDVEKNEMKEVSGDESEMPSEEKNDAPEKKTEKTPDEDKTALEATEKKQSSENKNKSQPQPEMQKAPTSEEIISKYMAQLYALQSAYTGRVESLISQGAAYYNNLVKTTDRATARSQTISHFTSIVRGEEASCDAQVESIISQMGSELNAIGADTSILQTVRSTYNSEKQLKMSYYASRYLN